MTDIGGHRRALLLWGGVFGFGLGAVLDVVIFHQILQTHHLLSSVYDPLSYDGLRTNVMFDGLFSLSMLLIAGLGATMLWRTVNRAREPLSGLVVVGAGLVGAGVFNVFDGVVDHYLLGIHDVVHGTEAWNPPWVLVSLLMLGAGLLALRVADRRDGPRDATEEVAD
ncbi:DUF2243 domain-containing protein [Halalkalicoccus jeotgali]|uniref:DUF2243 domain-containing protein n=1 Tax=Halalkalicoccus jeotgali (strain DSM 18796 / CECT 7217 / JCM 14584 / KCTC 4019 / B3) TaxID=795797 RepID=D8J4W9_HALJB|nr:DUF2243 domain-containing protein [Halalkalicoccus jeotgali]ADJ15586.1 hypothetical protein HacjB3_11015 [Halalkalicoccus jeotgali B3]ELY36336.1 hypothetical protein C497_11648 [Halalkalicoccus jeotgali B3]